MTDGDEILPPSCFFGLFRDIADVPRRQWLIGLPAVVACVAALYWLFSALGY